MNIKVTGSVKYGGKWYGPGDEIQGISEDEGNRIIKISAGVLLPKTQEEIAAEEVSRKAAEELANAEAKALADKEEADRKSAETKSKKEAADKAKAEAKE